MSTGARPAEFDPNTAVGLQQDCDARGKKEEPRGALRLRKSRDSGREE